MAELPKRAAFVFPGAGVPCCGAEAELVARHAGAFAPFLAAASSRAGVDFAEALAAGSIDAVPDREKQLFTYAFGAAFADLLCALGVAPAATAGYSFGVYAALYGARAMEFETGFDVLARAYAIMDEEIAGADYGMGIVVGLGVEEIAEIVALPRSEGLVLANSNSATCHVLSGPTPALLSALEAASQRDAISAQALPVSIPYHHPALLGRAAKRFSAYLGGVPFLAPRCPVVSSIDQRSLVKEDEIRAFVAGNLSTPISWWRVVGALEVLGAAVVVECGPGISLAQNARFIEGALPHVSVKTARGRLGL